MTRFLKYIFCVLLALYGVNTQANTWQPSAGHTQIPIWPGVAPDSQPTVKPEDMKIMNDTDRW